MQGKLLPSDCQIFYCIGACMQMYVDVFLTLRCENWHNDIFIIKNETKFTANIITETVDYGLVFLNVLHQMKLFYSEDIIPHA